MTPDTAKNSDIHWSGQAVDDYLVASHDPGGQITPHSHSHPSHSVESACHDHPFKVLGHHLQ